jgi:hypothetical protein
MHAYTHTYIHAYTYIAGDVRAVSIVLEERVAGARNQQMYEGEIKRERKKLILTIKK